jgi:hypothetical protein
MATQWNYAGNLKGPQGDDGPQGVPGDDGVSVTAATINSSGDLILTLSTGAEVNAGRAKGEPGGGIDFESSVPTVADLPATAPYGEARYVQADGHLYVFEADGGGEGVDGWTDVGPIKGEIGATGPAGADGADGADGVSVTGASIDTSGHLILTLSSGGPIDAGVAKGAKGDTGDAGADGADGATIAWYDTTPPAPGPYPVNSLAFDPVSGDVLRAV